MTRVDSEAYVRYNSAIICCLCCLSFSLHPPTWESSFLRRDISHAVRPSYQKIKQSSSRVHKMPSQIRVFFRFQLFASNPNSDNVNEDEGETERIPRPKDYTKQMEGQKEWF